MYFYVIVIIIIILFSFIKKHKFSLVTVILQYDCCLSAACIATHVVAMNITVTSATKEPTIVVGSLLQPRSLQQSHTF